MAWLGIFATLGWNYSNYRRGRATICAVTRRTLPRHSVIPVLLAGAVTLGVHIIHGYPKEH